MTPEERTTGLAASALWRERDRAKIRLDEAETRLREAIARMREARKERYIFQHGRPFARGRSLWNDGYFFVVTRPDDRRFDGPMWPEYPHDKPAVPSANRGVYMEAIREEVYRCRIHTMIVSVDIPRRRFWAIWDWDEGPIEKAVYVFRRQP